MGRPDDDQGQQVESGGRFGIRAETGELQVHDRLRESGQLYPHGRRAACPAADRGLVRPACAVYAYMHRRAGRQRDEPDRTGESDPYPERPAGRRTDRGREQMVCARQEQG